MTNTARKPLNKRPVNNSKKNGRALSPVNQQPAPVNKIGRPVGSKNRVTNFMRELMMMTADEVGDVTPARNSDGSLQIDEDGKIVYLHPPGEGGVMGYLKSVAREYPRTFVQGLFRMIPHQMKMEADNEAPAEQRLQSEDDIIQFLRKQGRPEATARIVAKKMVEAARELGEMD